MPKNGAFYRISHLSLTYEGDFSAFYDDDDLFWDTPLKSVVLSKKESRLPILEDRICTRSEARYDAMPICDQTAKNDLFFLQAYPNLEEVVLIGVIV